jgi:hypothetical protein
VSAAEAQPERSAAYSPQVLAYFAAHAIDPAVAEAVGVTGHGDRIAYPYADASGRYERTRQLAVDAKTRQPRGCPLAVWWPGGRPDRAETVLVVEGESDALAALTAAGDASLPPAAADIFGSVRVAAVPGASFPTDRLAVELVGLGVKRAILAPDADAAGDRFAERAAEALLMAGVASARLPLPEGCDLADFLSDAGADRGGWLASAIADLDCSGSAPSTASLLARVGALIGRYVVLPSKQALVALVLFVLHTWAIEAAPCTPYVVIVSAEKQSGKTRLLEVLALAVREPWHTASTTEAALFRKIEQTEPTLLLDEIDAIFGSSTERTEPLRACLNAGNRRGASVARCVGKGTKMEVKDFSVFCPKILAGIDTGKLPETIQDRAVMLHMKRRREGERVERLRYRFAVEEAAPLRADLEAWAAGAVEDLNDAIPELPDELSDRQADAWEPLFAIADLAGGDWPTRARAAAVELGATADGEEVGRGTQLLAAIRGALNGREVITTAELLEAINADEELPFGAWRDGKGLDARTLARMLKPYGSRPRTVRVGQETAKGYHAADLADIFARYLSPSEASPTSQASHQGQSSPEKLYGDGDVTGVTDVTLPAGTANEGPLDESDAETPQDSSNGHLDADAELARLAAEYPELVG